MNLKNILTLFSEEIFNITDLSAEIKSGKKFFIGIKPKGFDRSLNPEEAVYVVRKNSVYIFGDDAVNIKYSTERPGELKNKMLSEALNLAS